MKLWIAEVRYEFAVWAPDEASAMKVARRHSHEEESLSDDLHVRPARSRPAGWDKDSVVYGDAEERTIDELLALTKGSP